MNLLHSLMFDFHLDSAIKNTNKGRSSLNVIMVNNCCV